MQEQPQSIAEAVQEQLLMLIGVQKKVNNSQ